MNTGRVNYKYKYVSMSSMLCFSFKFRVIARLPDFQRWQPQVAEDTTLTMLGQGRDQNPEVSRQFHCLPMLGTVHLKSVEF